MLNWYTCQIAMYVIVTPCLSYKLMFLSVKSDLGPKWWTPNGTYLGLFNIRFGSASPNVLKTHLKKLQTCLIWCRSAPLWAWPSGKLTFECQQNCQKFSFFSKAIFFGKNVNFWQFFFKFSAIFCHSNVNFPEVQARLSCHRFAGMSDGT